MTPRARRYIGALAVLVAVLFVGRWSVEFVAERWWAATISPAAASFVTNWQLLGLALDVGAILIATVWFAIQALLVARAIASVQVTHRLGDLQLREAVPTRLLLGGAIASGVLLGLIAGAGAHAWRTPMVLASRGVTYGIRDPLLNLDVGVFVSQLPAWDLMHRFAVLLGVLGLGFCFALYSGIGAMRRERGTIAMHLDARRHIGVLLGVVSLTIAIGYRLVPYHLAAASVTSVTLAGMATRVRAAEIVSGIAIATAILSLVWALRGRNALVIAAWLVLAVGAAGERFVVPALVEEGPPVPSRMAAARRFDAVAWGIREAPLDQEAEVTPTITALWDEAVLGRVVERGGGVLEAATPADVTTADGQRVAVWLLATPPPGAPDELEILAVADSIAPAGGNPIMIRSAEESRSARPVWRTIADPRTSPLASAWQSVSTGVDARSPLRRLLLAWARQAPGMLGAQSHGDLDWHLDPTERAAAVLPMLSWLPADLVMVSGRPVWLVQGMRTINQFPLATHVPWRNENVAGVAPSVLGTIDAASGETHFYADPAADSLGAAWARIAGPLLEPAAALPVEIRGRVTYPQEWFAAQVAVLQTPAWNAGLLALQPGSTSPAPVWLPGRVPGLQVPLEDAAHTSIATIVTAYRAGGVPQLRLDHRDAESTLNEGRTELRQLWNRASVVVHLKDSATAAGDTVWSRPPRWLTGHSATAWQTVFAVPRRGSPTLLWIATAIGDRIGGGRNAAEAWRAVTEPERNLDFRGPDDAESLETARRSLQRADSALRRGDMTAFGRAFEEMRRALQRPPH